MIRRQTVILLAIFAVLLGAVLYIEKNPLPILTNTTPTPTSAPKLLEGWNSADIVFMEVKDGQSVIQIAQNDKGNWFLGPDNKHDVSAGVAGEISANITEFRSIGSLMASYQLQAVGLDKPTRVLTIRNKQGKQAVLRFGSATPTGDGYYVQVDSGAPVVMNKYTVDDTFNLFKNALPTPTPATPTPAATGAPAGLATPLKPTPTP